MRGLDYQQPAIFSYLSPEQRVPSNHPLRAIRQQEARNLRATPYVAQNNTGRRSAIDGRTTLHADYALSQQKRKRVEEIFGWMIRAQWPHAHARGS